MTITSVIQASSFVESYIARGANLDGGQYISFNHDMYKLDDLGSKYKVKVMPSDTNNMSIGKRIVRFFKEIFGVLPEQKTAKVLTEYFNIKEIRKELQSAETKEAYNEIPYGLRFKAHEQVAESLHKLLMEHLEWDVITPKDVITLS